MPYCQQFWMRKWTPGYVSVVGYLQSSYHLAGSSVSDLDRSVIVISYGLQVSVNTPFDIPGPPVSFYPLSTVSRNPPAVRRSTLPLAHPLIEPWSSAAMIWRWNSTKSTRVGNTMMTVPAHNKGISVA